MQLDRRRFIGATLAAGVAACTTRSAAPLAGPAVAPMLSPPAPSAPAPLPAVAVQSARPPLLAEALAALDTHRIAGRDRLALVDFSLPSREARFHLVDVAGGRIERSWLVAHGSGSDPAHTGLLQRFSNLPGSNASSDGAFLTADPYVGQHGRSQRLIGLDPTNDRALARAIVIHGAAYVDPALVERQGRIGRSQGCFAFEQGAVAGIMEQLGQGRLIYAGKLA
jgi:hypothetical protein